uniref:Vegetative cell wall protein gp1-like n=1 Tax=Castor canadensis TaxID=51338 RepID=A0A8B7UA68_CASCN|nr:vegetative cell wall protein gp1-like [Castor canadensis]
MWVPPPGHRPSSGDPAAGSHPAGLPLHRHQSSKEAVPLRPRPFPKAGPLSYDPTNATPPVSRDPASLATPTPDLTLPPKTQAPPILPSPTTQPLPQEPPTILRSCPVSRDPAPPACPLPHPTPTSPGPHDPAPHDLAPHDLAWLPRPCPPRPRPFSPTALPPTALPPTTLPPTTSPGLPRPCPSARENRKLRAAAALEQVQEAALISRRSPDPWPRAGQRAPEAAQGQGLLTWPRVLTTSPANPPPLPAGYIRLETLQQKSPQHTSGDPGARTSGRSSSPSTGTVHPPPRA